MTRREPGAANCRSRVAVGGAGEDATGGIYGGCAGCRAPLGLPERQGTRNPRTPHLLDEVRHGMIPFYGHITPALRGSLVNVLGVRRPALIPQRAGASAIWPPATKESPHRGSTDALPAIPRGDTPRRYPAWNGPPISSRRSLSLVPPSAKPVGFLHEDFGNDAIAFRWVYTISAFSLISSWAVTHTE